MNQKGRFCPSNCPYQGILCKFQCERKEIAKEKKPTKDEELLHSSTDQNNSQTIHINVEKHYIVSDHDSICMLKKVLDQKELEHIKEEDLDQLLKEIEKEKTYECNVLSE